MAKKHRVLVIEEDTLFGKGVELLLVLQENLEIVGTVPARLEAIRAKIEATHPDVILLNEDAAATNDQLILPLLKTYPDLRVITLSLAGNHINIYDNREVIVTTINDLVTAIIQPK